MIIPIGNYVTFNQKTYFVLYRVHRNTYMDNFFVGYYAEQMGALRRVLANEANILLETTFTTTSSYRVFREDGVDDSQITKRQHYMNVFLDAYFYVKHRVLRLPNVEPWLIEFHNYRMRDVTLAVERARKLYLLTAD